MPLPLTDTQLETLYDNVDESDYSLQDWQDALATFDRWLEQHEIAIRPIDAMLGYLHCCTMTLAETLPPPDLSATLVDMLDQHGFDAAKDAEAAKD